MAPKTNPKLLTRGRALERFDQGARELRETPPAELRSRFDADARAENPAITDEQLDWSWRQAAELLGL